MTAPTKKLRGWVYLRDGFRCLDCGTNENLSFQHRESSGHGGRGSKAPALRTADGVTLCIICNEACESYGQDRALALGWKIRRNRGSILASQIPFFDRNDRIWYLPNDLMQDGPWRREINSVLAAELLGVAGSLMRGRNY
jgi:hypothetical protein